MSVDIIAVVVTVVGIAAALIARKTWLIIEGDLAESWRWILPSVPVYAISFTFLIAHNFLRKYEVAKPVISADFGFDLAKMQMVFTMQIWKPILLVLKNMQVLTELLFLVLVLIGLVRQYNLFRELSDK